MRDKMLVGWREWVELPQLGIPAVKVKIDTGARTSALHVFDLEVYAKDGRQMVHFGIHPLQRRQDIILACTAEVIDERVVSDSGGHRERRPIIRTMLNLDGAEWPIEISLTNREDMLFRMLLGRTAMQGRLVVDPELAYQCGRKLRNAYRSRPITRKRNQP